MPQSDETSVADELVAVLDLYELSETDDDDDEDDGDVAAEEAAAKAAESADAAGEQDDAAVAGETWLAKLEYRADGRLVLLEMLVGREDQVRGTIERVNAMPEMLLRDTQGPASGRASEVVAVPRGTPEFLGALRTYLETYHGLTLG